MSVLFLAGKLLDLKHLVDELRVTPNEFMVDELKHRSVVIALEYCQTGQQMALVLGPSL